MNLVQTAPTVMNNGHVVAVRPAGVVSSVISRAHRQTPVLLFDQSMNRVNCVIDTLSVSSVGDVHHLAGVNFSLKTHNCSTQRFRKTSLLYAYIMMMSPQHTSFHFSSRPFHHRNDLFQISLSVLLATCHHCALILLETSTLYLFIYLLTYLLTNSLLRSWFY